jgi:uncharacterized membrane protein YqjE
LSGTGPLASLRRLAQTGLALVLTRLELLAVELRQEELRVFDALVLGVFGCVLLGLGAVLLALLLVVLFWDDHRMAVLVALTLLFAASGAGLLLLARDRLRRTRPFAATLGELRTDREAIGPRDVPP